METIHLSVPEPIKRFIDEQVARGNYRSADEYFTALVEADHRRQADEELEAKLIEGLESGPPVEVTPEFWEEFHARLRERRQKQNGS
jgi:antitoxin ParD1/3/4